MSNFDILQPEKLESLIEPYASGMTPNITPIKFEAITPDSFALLFRTSGRDDKDYYFVSLEYDYIESLQKIKEIIEKWHGSPVIEFLYPEDQSSKDSQAVKTTDIYQGVLARVERPTGTGYWATSVNVDSKDDVDDAVAASGLSFEKQKPLRDGLNKIFEDHPNVRIIFYVDEDGKIDFVYK